MDDPLQKLKDYEGIKLVPDKPLFDEAAMTTKHDPDGYHGGGSFVIVNSSTTSIKTMNELYAEHKQRQKKAKTAKPQPSYTKLFENTGKSRIKRWFGQ